MNKRPDDESRYYGNRSTLVFISLALLWIYFFSMLEDTSHMDLFARWVRILLVGISLGICSYYGFKIITKLLGLLDECHRLRRENETLLMNLEVTKRPQQN